MLTFEQARAAVQAARASSWTGKGTYAVSRRGLADDNGFLLVDGAREYLEDGDSSFAVMNDAVVLVDPDGRVSTASAAVPAIRDRIDRMKTVTD